MFVEVHGNEPDWQTTAAATLTIYFKLNKHHASPSGKGSRGLMGILDEESPKIQLLWFPQDTFKM